MEAEDPDCMSSTLVLQAGSGTFRFGMAGKERPRLMPNVIAYKRRRPLSPPLSEPATASAALATFQSALNEQRRQFKQRFKKMYERGPTNAFFGEVQETIYDDTNNWTVLEGSKLRDAEKEWSWFEPQEGSAFVVGDQALHLRPDSGFELFWPIKRGRFASSPKSSSRKVLDSLERIIRFVVVQEMEIPAENLKNCTAVLVIPDEMSRREIAELYTLVLHRIGFGSCFCHQESVLACFGAGLSSACVIDIGKEKTHVCCVRDGIVVPESSRTMPVGGDDISRTLLLTLFNSSETGEHAFPFKRDAEVGSERRFDWSNPQHKHFLDVLKQNMCEFAPASAEDAQYGKSETHVLRSLKGAVLLGLNMTMARYFAPQVLFIPELLSPKSAVSESHPLHFIEDDVRPYDYMDKDALDQAPALTGRIKDTRRGDKGLTPSGKAAPPLREVCRRSILQVGYGTEQDTEAAVYPPGPSMLPLHTEVASSLAAVDDLEQRRLLASQILLVGGSAKIPRIIDELEDRLFESIASFLLDSDKVEVVQNSKYADASVMSWTGASIVAGTDGMKGCLVSRDEWEGTALGVHVLRARLPFAWET